MRPFFETLVEFMTEDLFLREFSGKYHYDEEQMTLLKEVSFAMQEKIRQDNEAHRAGWEYRQESRPEAVMDAVCMTLGPGVDRLQESYLKAGQLTEGYMVETLASELLLKAYPQWNARIAEETEYRVKRYHFLGSEVSCPIEKLPELLRELAVPVTCNEAYCMLPKKSVAFYAELVAAKQATGAQDSQAQATEAAEHFCEGICAGCNSSNCPNRMEKRHGNAWETDMTDRPFTYGYQRIFGIR